MIIMGYHFLDHERFGRFGGMLNIDLNLQFFHSYCDSWWTSRYIMAIKELNDQHYDVAIGYDEELLNELERACRTQLISFSDVYTIFPAPWMKDQWVEKASDGVKSAWTEHLYDEVKHHFDRDISKLQNSMLNNRVVITDIVTDILDTYEDKLRPNRFKGD